MNAEQFAEQWELALDDPDRIWPEDVLAEDEWERGWFDRQVIQGALIEADRPNYPLEFGGTAS